MDETREIEKSANHGDTYNKKCVAETIILSEEHQASLLIFFKKIFFNAVS